MVTRAYGFANGQAITLTRDVGDFWTAEVPYNEDGEYVVELYAEDEAGNIGYMCTILFVVSGHEMQTFIVPRGYKTQGNKNDYTACPIIEGVKLEIKKATYKIERQEGGYGLKAMEGGYTVEHAVCRYNGH